MSDPRAMFRFRVWPDGGDPYEVDSTMRDVIRWERTTKTKATGLKHLQETLYTADLVKICYLASVRHGLFTGTAAEFEDQCDWTVLPDAGHDDARQAVVDAAVTWRRDDAELGDLAAAVNRLLDVEAGEPDPTRPAR